MRHWLWRGCALVQALLGASVMLRLARTALGTTIPAPRADAPPEEGVAILVPVLNERARLAPCLDGLIGQGAAVREILVIDGGSTDGTQSLVRDYMRRDRRVRLIDASPVPPSWNGKAWGLECGLQAADPACDWLLTVDADVRPAPSLVAALLQHALDARLAVLSVATRQEIDGVGQGFLHPAMLTTLVYRFGIPGGRYRRVGDVQANGQCFLAHRSVLERVGGFASVRDSICEDVTLARLIVAQGTEVGFFESDGLVTVRMHPDWRATWRDWPRSLPMRDRFWGARGWLGLAEVLLVQAAPLPLLLAQWRRGATVDRGVTVTWVTLVATRLGVLFGTRRAYVTHPWSYWLSPLADLPVAGALVASAFRRRHTWRGRALIRGT
jgi:dolichol-phosphate mannosyltransferase